MAQRRSPGLSDVLRRRSQDGLLSSAHRAYHHSPQSRPILKRQSHHVRHFTRRLGSVGDSSSSGDGWLSAGSYPDLLQRRSKSSEDTPNASDASPSNLHAFGKMKRRQESVTYEESIPVIVRRRGCTMTVRIVSVDDIDDEDEDEVIEQLYSGSSSSQQFRIPKTPNTPRCSLLQSLSATTRSTSSTPSPRCLSSLSLPQVRKHNHTCVTVIYSIF